MNSFLKLSCSIEVFLFLNFECKFRVLNFQVPWILDASLTRYKLFFCCRLFSKDEALMEKPGDYFYIAVDT